MNNNYVWEGETLLIMSEESEVISDRLSGGLGTLLIVSEGKKSHVSNCPEVGGGCVLNMSKGMLCQTVYPQGMY